MHPQLKHLQQESIDSSIWGFNNFTPHAAETATTAAKAPQLTSYITKTGEGRYISPEQTQSGIFEPHINYVLEKVPRYAEHPDAMKCWYDLTQQVDPSALPYSKLLKDADVYAEWTTSNPLLMKQGLAYFDGVLHQMYCVKPAVFDFLAAAAGQSDLALSLAKLLGI